MPAQDRVRGDQAMATQCAGQPPDERGEHGPVRPVQARSWVGAAQHGDLVAQHEELDVLGGGRAAQQQDQPEHLPEDQVQQPQRHAGIMSDQRSPLVSDPGPTSGTPQDPSCFAVSWCCAGPVGRGDAPGTRGSVILEGEGESIDGSCTTLVRVIRRCFPAPPYRRSLAGLLAVFRPCFTAPTFPTFVGLVVGLIAQTRRRTVCGMLTGAGLEQVWHHSRAHRLFTNARWSGDALGLALADLIVARLLPADRRSRSRSTTRCSSGPGRRSSGWPGITTGPRRARNPSGSATAGSWPASSCSCRFCPARCACRCWPGCGDPGTPGRSPTPASWPS